MRLQRLPTEMLTTQHLADDANSLIPVDRLRRIRLGQRWIIFQEFFTNPGAEWVHTSLRSRQHPIDGRIQSNPSPSGDTVLGLEGQVSLFLPILDRYRQGVQGILQLFDALRLLINSAT
ncbi:hypothetical protein HMPREF9057_02177 [Actinomyces sp. oral taxon 171 str. F0337]|nr:hypothetical protein HMPREF9057_02177 [Actinomyces sp. oral taxon 171 str. F0337]